jgi:transposase
VPSMSHAAPHGHDGQPTEETAAFPTTTARLPPAAGLGTRLRPAPPRRGEGTGSDGAALTRHLRRQRITVVEVNRPDRAARRRHGKSDTVDATAAAHAVLSARATGTAKTGDGPVEMLRLLHLARASAVKSRTQAIHQLTAVIIGADPALRETLSGLSRTALIRHCAGLPAVSPTDVATATVYTLRHLALRIQHLTVEERQLQRQITAVLDTHAVQLVQRHGVGPDSAALYRIALTRSRGDHRTRDYLERRATQGLTRREAIRCLKRYIAREIYQLLHQISTAQTPRTA